MSLKHKYRITGVIILLIALITFLPSLFQQDAQKNHSDFSTIPEQPQKQILTPSTPVTQSVEKSAESNDVTHSMSNNTIYTTETQGVVIQIGSFMNQHHIDEIKAKLSLLNYHVYTIPVVPIEGKLTRVLVGPYPTKQQAESALQQLEQETKLKGKLIMFNPLKD